MIKLYKTFPYELLENRWPNVCAVDTELQEYVKPILIDVQTRGDEALLEYTERFDNVKLDPDEINISKEKIKNSYSKVSGDQIRAFVECKRRLEQVESRRMELLSFDITVEGVQIQNTVRPLARVGCYVPGGKARYPSSLLMNVVPAKVAGVNEVIVCTPPGRNGEVDPLTLVAADICGVDKIFSVGGAQAIGAMAYGTMSIPRVDKVVGPGNRFVTAAKSLVSNSVAIDKPAGPSEILILADSTADPYLIALDMISQAEHGQGGLSGLVTPDGRLASSVAENITRLIGGIPKSSLVKEVLSAGGFIFNCKDVDEAIKFTNRYAPEHLEIMTENPERVAESINTAGMILLGSYTPVSATDYCMGINHVLPTGGYGKISSGITVLDFLKPISVVKSSKDGLMKVAGYVKTLAEAEGLPNHSLAVEGRFNR
jgi:histidinol dehydrogenase